MDFARDLTEHEHYAMRTITRHDEIDEWLSDRVKMRIIRSIAGGFGTVYCVVPPCTHPPLAPLSPARRV